MTDTGSDLPAPVPAPVVARTWEGIRAGRGRNAPNSRPVPPWVRRLAWILDDAVEVPGMPGRRVGVDGMIAFIPVVGDAAGVVLGSIIVTVGVVVGVSFPTVVRMVFNVVVEAVVGLVPFLGAVFDLVYKSNNRNLALIEADLADRAATRRSSAKVLLSLVFVAISLVVLILFIVSAAIAVLVWLIARWF